MREGGGMMFGLKREIEEKTSDYNRRVAEAAAEQKAVHQKQEARRAQVRAEADAAAPERLKLLLAAERKDQSAWRFNCTVRGGFIVLRWTDGGKDVSHALNLSAVTDIVKKPGVPVKAKGDGLKYNDYRWEFGIDRGERYWTSFTSPYWSHEIYEPIWPSDARAAVIKFAGPDFLIERIPARKADAAYEAIMAAIEAAPSPIPLQSRKE